MTNRGELTDDELLGAWLDGELPPEEAERVGRRLAAEPALMRRLEAMRAADRAAQSVFHAVDDAPLPKGVVDMLERNGAGEDSRANVVEMPVRAPHRFFQLPVALAASVALVAGFLVHDLVTPERAQDFGLPVSGIVARDSGLHRMLETAQAAEAVVLAEGTDAEVVLTFRAEDGDWCRQFKVAGTASSSLHALACRQPDGWRLETAGFGVPGPADGAFGQAAPETPAALEAAVRARLGDREPLSPEAEKEIISTGWN